MSGQVPNSTNISMVAAGVANTTAVVVHPEYIYHRPEWQKLRDVIAGQREIKRKSTIYLRAFKKMDQPDYQQYLEGATFYNMTAQTLNGMIGEVFSRDPLAKNVPKKFKDTIRLKFAKDGSGHIGFSKTIISEILTMGRYGVLVDAPSTPSVEPISFAVGYSAENILDWTVEEINGIYQLTRVLLREFTRNKQRGPSFQNPWIGQADPAEVVRLPSGANTVRQVGGYIEAYTYATHYRELCLEQQEDGTYVYKQYVYNEDPNGEAYDSFTPNVRGVPLDFIPFMMFGASGNTADVEKSPLLDIADLNLSHYRTYADLEWGRTYTALPVYYAPGRDDEGAAEYTIGPSVVWEVPPDQDPPGIIEYKGEGLKQLESALNTKERQIAAIGGRLMPGTVSKGSESPDQAKRAQATEQSLILNAIQATEFGMTQVMRWWLMWRDVALSTTENVGYSLNRMFGQNAVGAREMRVMQQMYSDGILPIDAVYAFCVKAGWIDPDMELDDFKALLDNPDSFVNNPDAQARQRGFSSRQQELDQVTVAREADMQQEEIDLQEREVVLMENAPPPAPPAPPSPAQAAVPSRPAGPKPANPGKAAAKVKKPTASGK